LDIEANVHLSHTTDSEIMQDLLSITCREIGNYWLVIELRWLGGLTAEK
jgi:hypothetical protein